MKNIISYSVKIGKVSIECFTSQTYGSEEAALNKAKDFYNAYLAKTPNSDLSIVRTVKIDKVKWL